MEHEDDFANLSTTSEGNVAAADSLRNYYCRQILVYFFFIFGTKALVKLQKYFYREREYICESINDGS